MSSVEEWLKREVRDYPFTRPMELGYRSVFDFVLKHGRPWTVCSGPGQFWKGQPGVCFGNACDMVEMHDGLLYIEGLALAESDGASHGVLHAWNALADTLYVVDTTPQDSLPAEARLSYYGVAFRTDYVLAVRDRRNGCNSVIDHWEERYPLLNDAAIRDAALWRPARRRTRAESQPSLPGLED